MKCTPRTKLKAACQEERLQMWKENLKNLLGNFLKVTIEPITKIINRKIDIKPGQFTQKLNVEQAKNKNRKATGLDEIPPEDEEI